MSNSNNKWINDPYTNKARDKKLVARSYFKLEEIDKKFELFTSETKTILDIWCAPWSWLQYCSQKVEELWVKDPTIIWFDLKRVIITLPHTYPYQQDITDREWVSKALENHAIESLDLIVSDMAPDTIGMKDIDALRSVWLIEKNASNLWKILSRLRKICHQSIYVTMIWRTCSWFERDVWKLKYTSI